jgi:hypothetical protein
MQGRRRASAQVVQWEESMHVASTRCEYQGILLPNKGEDRNDAARCANTMLRGEICCLWSQGAEDRTGAAAADRTDCWNLDAEETDAVVVQAY